MYEVLIADSDKSVLACVLDARVLAPRLVSWSGSNRPLQMDTELCPRERRGRTNGGAPILVHADVSRESLGFPQTTEIKTDPGASEIPHGFRMPH